jgi:PAS domain S-box-containing protein
LKNTLEIKSRGRLSFEQKILLYLFLVISIIAVIVYLFLDISSESRRTRDWVTHTEKVLVLSDSVVSTQRNVVIGTRSYIITANESYLGAAVQSDKSFTNHLAQLRLLTSDNLVQQRRLDSIKDVYNEYKVTRDHLVALRNRSDFRLSQMPPLLAASDSALSKLQTIFGSLQSEEKRLLDERRVAYQKNAQLVSRILSALVLLFIISILLAFLIVYRNSKKRSKAEQALRKSEELVRSIINYAPILVNVKDTSGKYILVNRQMATALNTDPEEMIGKGNRHFLSPEKADAITKEEQHVIERKEPAEMELRLDGHDGEHTYITSKFPLLDGHGKLYAIGSTSVDITPLKKAHEALEQSFRQQQRMLNGLQQTLSASSDLLCIINVKGEIVMISDTAADLFGYTPKELMSKRYMDFIVEEDRAQTELIAAQIMAGEPVADFTNRYKRKDGSQIPIIWSAKWVAQDNLMYCIARDCTERIKTARQLAQSQARLSHAQKIARLGNWDWDLKNNQWSCSEELYDLLGIAKDETGSIQKLLFEAIHPDDRPMLEMARNEALTLGKKVNVEHRVTRADGRVCYMHTIGEIILDKEANPVWFSGTMQDISHRKKEELKLQQLNEELKKGAIELKASNAELERFAYVASHDLQEPLRMVTSFLGLLEKKHKEAFDETSKKYIHFAVDGAERMKGLIQDLLHYSRLGSPNEKLSSVDLREVMDDVLHMCEHAVAKSNAVIQYEHLPVINGNKVQLTQLFQNLIGNALKYRSLDNPFIQIHCKQEENHWLFSVKDNGIGIDQKYFDKIFVIFQRLHNKDQYGGTGIGLAICKKIVENHGGRIWVESRPEGGSTFYITLSN